MRLGDRVGVVGIRAAVVGYLGYLVAFGIGVDQRGREIVLDAEIILLVEGIYLVIGSARGLSAQAFHGTEHLPHACRNLGAECQFEHVPEYGCLAVPDGLAVTVNIVHLAVVGLAVLTLVVYREDGVGIVQAPPPLAAGSAEVIRIGVLRPLVGSGRKLHEIMMEYGVADVEAVGYGSPEKLLPRIDEQFIQLVGREG